MAKQPGRSNPVARWQSWEQTKVFVNSRPSLRARTIFQIQLIMEITNEVTEKVFAQYLGQPFGVLFKNGTEMRASYFTASDLSMMYEGHLENKGNLYSLFLRPLSAITDEDAKRVVELTYYDTVVKSMSVRAGIIFVTIIQNGYKLNQNIQGSNLSFSAAQYLQSKGYDLPHYLLGGKTLKEAGLAVYE